MTIHIKVYLFKETYSIFSKDSTIIDNICKENKVKLNLLVNLLIVILRLRVNMSLYINHVLFYKILKKNIIRSYTIKM